MKSKESTRLEAIRLRVEERNSYDEIIKKLDIARGTLYYWLKDYPLTSEELRLRKNKNDEAKKTRKYTPNQSKYHLLSNNRILSNEDKGRIAEAAVLFRLTILGFNLYSSVYEKDKIDILIEKDNTFKKIQIKWARILEKGMPTVSLRCSDTRKSLRKYKENECDYVVGYDLYSDTCYVWDFKLIKNKTCIAVTKESEENWKCIQFL